MTRYYPESKVEIQGFFASHYDTLLSLATFGIVPMLMKNVIKLMEIKPSDRILDLGAGTGSNACLMVEYLKNGEIVGLDISREMIHQFKRKCSAYSNVKILNKRIDKPLTFQQEFDKAFISFTLHGFPQHARRVIIRNAFNALKNEGEFFILDYGELHGELPPYLKVPFEKIECPYALDFMRRNWKKILKAEGFDDFKEYMFFGKILRMLRAVKLQG